MARIPVRNENVSPLEDEKLWNITYVFEECGRCGKQAETWHIRARSIGEALSEADEWCASQIDSGEWVQYEIVSINVIRGCE